MRSSRPTNSKRELTLAVLFLSGCGIPHADLQDRSQRIPRQAFPASAAVEGIIRTDIGLGLGGVAITLINTANGAKRSTTTTGDGAFRFLNVAPGRYQLTAERDGFASFERDEIGLAAGDVFGLEFTMKSVPTGMEGMRELPRQPGLGPKPPPGPVEPVISSSYRKFLEQPPPETTGDMLPQPPLATDAELFEVIPNRWNFPFPTEYKRYPQGEVPYVEGHWYDPFNRNKFKGDYPIIGNRTFLNFNLTSDTFVDGRRLPTPSGLGSANPDSSNFYGRFGQYLMTENVGLAVTLFHGDTSFRPIDWQIKVEPVININYLAVQENGIVNVDPTKGTTRLDTHVGLQEGFVEAKIADVSPSYILYRPCKSAIVCIRCWIGVQDIHRDRFGLCCGDGVNGAGRERTRPRETAEPVYARLIDGNNRNIIRRR